MTELHERIPNARITQQIAATERYHWRKGYDAGIADMQTQVALYCIFALLIGVAIGGAVVWFSRKK